MSNPFAILLASLLAAVVAVPSTVVAGDDEDPDPSKAYVSLPARGGWNGSLVIDNGKVGIWTVRAINVFPQYGTPELVGLDDHGQCHVMIGYSGKWTPKRVIHDGLWLGGLAHGDVDPRVDQPEFYTGGQKGNLYQVLSYPHGALDARLIAHFSGLEIHTVLAGDLDDEPGPELLVFTRPGALYRCRPDGPHGRFTTVRLCDVPGRVRDARVIPGTKDIVTVSRNGRIASLRLTGAKPTWTTIHAGGMGLGRITLAPERPGKPTAFYTGMDDGRIWRFERRGESWASEVIYVGPQGTRGVAAGRFDRDPSVETIAVFGYSKKVQMLSRRGGVWKAETIFVDRDKGHWLGAAELDGRNGTDELFGSGYGGRIFMLSRPPGYGLDGVATEPKDDEDSTGSKATKESVRADVRIAIGSKPCAVDRLTPLCYHGGFLPKTMIYETLVRRDATGRIAPALAASWSVSPDGRTFDFRLRDGARFHDGEAVRARDVALHFRRWVGLPEHGWLGACEQIRAVDAVDDRTLRIRLAEPYALLPDLCAINPCSITAPGTLDRDGDFERPRGSGAYRFGGLRENGGVVRLVHVADGHRIDLVRMSEDEKEDPAALLRAGKVDVLFDNWGYRIPRRQIDALRRDGRFEVADGPGSINWFISFASTSGPTRHLAVRRRIERAIDRRDLIDRVEHGFADPSSAYAAPGLSVWPQPASATATVDAADTAQTLRLRMIVADDARARAIADVLRRQFADHAIELTVISLPDKARRQALADGRFDLQLERTWGLPYDPDISMAARLSPPPRDPSAARERFFGIPTSVADLVTRARREPREDARAVLYRQIQAILTRETVIVPLFASRRFVVKRRGIEFAIHADDEYRCRLVRS